MPKKQRMSKVRKPSVVAMRDAIEVLGPPGGELSPRIQNNLAQLLSRPNVSNAAIAAALKRAGLPDPPPMHTMGGGSPFAISAPRISLLAQLMNSLYLPVDDPSFYVPPSHRYVSGQVWGHGVALKETGFLRVNQYVDIAQSTVTSSAGLYSQIFTTPSDYGQVSQGSFEPDVSWNATGGIAINSPWGSNVFGSVTVIGRLWLAAYEWNPATNQFEQLIAVPHVLFNETDHGLVVRSFSHGGSFNSSAFPLKYILNPARTHWLGAIISVEVRQNFVSADRNHPNIPAPTLNDLSAFAVLTANVPAMWIDHMKLA